MDIEAIFTRVKVSRVADMHLRKRLRIIVAVATVSSFCIGAINTDTLAKNTTSSSDLKKKLKGRIVKDEEPAGAAPKTIPQEEWDDNIVSKLKIGSPYGGEVLPAAEEVWHPIPEWAAGRWEAVKPQDAKHRSLSLGLQTDKNGGIWTMSRAIVNNRLMELEEPDTYVLNVMGADRLLANSAQQLKLQHKDTCVTYSKRSKKVRRVLVTQFTETINREDNNRLDEVEDTEHLVDLGFNLGSNKTKSTIQYQRLSPFVVNNDVEVRESFKKYLRAHGHADLVP